MSRRASIAEVRLVSLGESGKDQQIPVLETLTDGSHDIGKTTVAAMAEYLLTEAAADINRIQRFFLKSTQTHTLTTLRNQQAGRSNVATRLQFEKQATSRIAGSDGAFSLINDNIRVDLLGFYKITLNIVATRGQEDGYVSFPELEATKGTLEIVNGEIVGVPFVEPDNAFRLDPPTWIPNLTITPLDRITNYYGIVQPTSWSYVSTLSALFSQQIIYQAKNRDPLEFLVSMYNSGSNDAEDPVTWTLTGGNSPIASNIIIEKI